MRRIVNLPPIPERPADGHKGLFGRILVVGGHEAMIGAPVLAATSALRCGSGLVQIAMPKNVLTAALSITPELIGLALPAATVPAELKDNAKKSAAVVLGPGLGQSSFARLLVRTLIQIDTSIVIDADALNILSAGKSWPKKFVARAVLTPHPGEMKRLGKLIGVSEIPSDDDGRIGVALKAARAFQQIIVLKGHRTIVSDGDRVFVNRTGDSTLSKAGAGDVLSGVIASLIGQKMDRFEAACAGVCIHGIAGEMAGEKFTRRGALARDVIDALPHAIRIYEQRAGSVTVKSTAG